MPTRALLCLLPLAALLLTTCSPGAPAPSASASRSGGAAGAGASLVEVLDRVRTQAGAPGAILGVKVDGGPPLVITSGLADRETGRLLTLDTPYHLGSVSKTYTAVVILRLAEEGRLSLDDTLDRFLPAFPDASKITLRHLLGHTSGLKDFYLYFYLRPERQEMIDLVTRRWSQEELLGYAARFGRHFEPGTDWDYSNNNYFLLGVVAERASGLSLPAAYQRYVYQPLGLHRTWLAQHEEPRSTLPMPIGYMGPVKEWQHSEMFGELGATTVLDASSAEWGSGGLVAPAEEALRFLEGLLGGKLLASPSLEAMRTFRVTPPLGQWTSDTAPPDRSSGYGLGLVEMERPGYTLIGHGGAFSGHTAGLWHVADCGVTFALYLNRGLIPQRGLLDRIVPAITRGPDGSSRCGR
ncbi:MAG TPA: serine hydrolase domain-containing protein [Thermoanaerobaculia bacterium]|nr:serine hydrolase domain-containing protein [Thermoanaerobaculia bacterium]